VKHPRNIWGSDGRDPRNFRGFGFVYSSTVLSRERAESWLQHASVPHLSETQSSTTAHRQKAAAEAV
ncbi:MAG TPA: hypothetical protein VK745_04050, partial [Polyangiaceae bacterium]|nr:hypothetical protein [Polyangiaceae bacterium]